MQRTNRVAGWAPIAHTGHKRPAILLSIQACQAASPSTGSGQVLRWLQVQGTARPVAAPDWAGLLPTWTSATPPDALYLVVRVTPQRMDLFNESRGWGARETLEL